MLSPLSDAINFHHQELPGQPSSRTLIGLTIHLRHTVVSPTSSINRRLIAFTTETLSSWWQSDSFTVFEWSIQLLQVTVQFIIFDALGLGHGFARLKKSSAPSGEHCHGNRIKWYMANIPVLVAITFNQYCQFGTIWVK